jgi:hypothetical protein
MTSRESEPDASIPGSDVASAKAGGNGDKPETTNVEHLLADPEPSAGARDDGNVSEDPADQLRWSAEQRRQFLEGVAREGADVPDAAKLFGVRPEILNRFLVLLRDRYPLVDKANFFLELEQGISGINVAITNQRDALSHFVTILSRDELSEDQQLAQLAHAEEHLRRATLEPYAIAVALEAKKLLAINEVYLTEVVPLLNDPRFSAAPLPSRINAVLKEMLEMRAVAREAKARNTWDDSWEEGVTSLVAVFRKAREMHERLGHYIGVARQVREGEQRNQQYLLDSDRTAALEKKNRRLTNINIFLAVLSVLLGLLGVLVALK